MSSIDEVRAGGKPVVTMCGAFQPDVEAIGCCVSELLGITWHHNVDHLDRVWRVFAGESERQAMDHLLTLLQADHFDPLTEVLSPVDRIVVSDIIARNGRLLMHQAAEGGVLCGCHAAYVLRDLPNAIHVRIDSPLADRADEVARTRRVSPQQAEALLDAEARLRIELAKFAHGYDPDDNQFYDVVINMARFDRDEAAHLIARTVRQQQAIAAA